MDLPDNISEESVENVASVKWKFCGQTMRQSDDREKTIVTPFYNKKVFMNSETT